MVYSFCPSREVDGVLTRLPCPQGYGAIIGTACICALLEIGLSFAPAKVLKRVFPPLVTGPTVVLIGVNLVSAGSSRLALQHYPFDCMVIILTLRSSQIGTGFENWAG